MKKDKLQNPPASAAAPATAGAEATKEAEKLTPPDLGLTERRKFIRPLPVPEVLESDGDSAWGAFQALISEDPEK